MTSIPFAIGEELANKWSFAPYLEDQITQFARVDVCTVGGFTEAIKVAAMAETHYIDVMPHNPLGPVGNCRRGAPVFGGGECGVARDPRIAHRTPTPVLRR